MKKKLAVILSSVTVAIGASYFITGGIIKNNLIEAVNKLNANEQFPVTVVSYKRGIFTSSAEIEYATDDSENKLVFLQKISHGPIIAGQTSKGFRVNFAAGKIRTTPKTILEDKLTITTLVGFNRHATTWLHLEKIDDIAPSSFRVAWDDFHGEFKHDFPMTRLSGEIHVPLVKVATDDWQLTLEDIKLSRLDTYNNFDFTVQAEYSLGELTFARQDIELVKLGGAVMSLQADGNQETSNVAMKCNIARSRIVDQKFAEDQFIFEANKLHRSTLDNISGFAMLNPYAVTELAKHYGSEIVANSDLKVEFPKYFTETLLAYLSFEIYRGSPIGKLDQRPTPEVLRDISSSINSLVQDAVKNKLILEKGSNYALNFDLGKQG